MSFREVRSYCELMRELGYQRLISVENFRTPNFELVAENLEWLVRRYDPKAEVSSDISTIRERVNFLQSVGGIMYTKARVKLNLKKLYAADAVAVKELLKVARLLSEADRSTGSDAVSETLGPPDLSLGGKLAGVRTARQLASDIVRTGARLHDALVREPALSRARARAIGDKLVDRDAVERQLAEKLAAVRQSEQAMQAQLQSLEKNRRHLEEKIEKRQRELDRSQQRLNALQAVKPAYLEEYERMQGELQGLFQQYAERQRNLDYLQKRLTDYQRAEEARLKAHKKRLAKMQQKIKQEELRVLRGDGELDDSNLDPLGDSGEVDFSDDDDGSPPSGGGAMANTMRPSRGARANGGRAAPDAMAAQQRADAQRGMTAGGGGRRGAVMGSLAPAGLEDDDDSGISDLGGGSDSMGEVSMGEGGGLSDDGGFVGGPGGPDDLDGDGLLDGDDLSDESSDDRF